MKVSIRRLKVIEKKNDVLLKIINTGNTKCRISFLAKYQGENISAIFTLEIDHHPAIHLVEKDRLVKEINFSRKVTKKLIRYEKEIEINVDKSLRDDITIGLKLKKKKPYSPRGILCPLGCIPI